MNETARTALADRLAAGAAGSQLAEAAIYIVTTTVNGALVDRLAGFIEEVSESCAAWVNWPEAVEASGPLSGGERRLVALAASLHQGTPVNLGDALSGLDATNAHHVLTALAHALGVQR